MAIPCNHLTIFMPDSSSVSTTFVSHFLLDLNNYSISTSIFYKIEKYFKFIEINQRSSLATTSLLLTKHTREILEEIRSHDLNHRLNLFIFWFHSRKLTEKSHGNKWKLDELFRVMVIMSPRPNLFRIYYNQVNAKDVSRLYSYNWYDVDENPHFRHFPLLPYDRDTYKNFNGRTFYIPVIHVISIVFIL